MKIVSIIFRCHERDEVKFTNYSILRYFRKYDKTKFKLRIESKIKIYSNKCIILLKNLLCSFLLHIKVFGG